LDVLYNEIGDVEANIATIQERIRNIKAEKIHGDNVYAFLQYYGIMYDRFTGSEKKIPIIVKTILAGIASSLVDKLLGKITMKSFLPYTVVFNGYYMEQ